MRPFAVAVICVASCRFDLPPPGALVGDGEPAGEGVPADAQQFDLACLRDASYAANGAHRYRVIDTAVDYDGAVDRCTLDGAHVAVIDDAAENAFVRGLSGSELWIGYDDLTREGTFAWVTGAAVGFENWNGGEPNDQNTEDCVYMRSDGLWNDTACEETRPVACECDATYQPPPTPACRTLNGADVLAGRRYFPHTTAASWQAAEADCETIGATLPAIADLDENTIVASRFASDAWLGYSDATTEGAFAWSNGAPAGFEHWNSTSPSPGPTGDAEDCAHLDFPNNDWNDTECSAQKVYVCECDPARP